MVRLRQDTRIRLVALLAVVALAISACYKDAGENVQPTSNRVDLSDIQPTAEILPTDLPAATSTPEDTAEPDEGAEPEVTATRTLLPTITPAGEGDEEDAAGASSLQVAPSFTPAPVNPTATTLGITTPGMSDIIPTSTPAPTIDPTLLPTNTPLPPGANPCIHVVQPGDTLFSIARNKEVELGALVAANSALLGGSEFTTLQLGWELNIPGCTPPGATPPAAEAAPADDAGVQPTAAAPGQQTTHVVQPGDTVFSIGRQYGVSADAIIAANNLANPNRLDVGQTLVIPAP
jgi:LysM repeat protein